MYYKPRKIKEKPYLLFDAVAMSDEELMERNLCENKNPAKLKKGIYAEKDLPKLKYGIIPFDLTEQGGLIPISQSVLDQVEKQHLVMQKAQKNAEIDENTRKEISKGFDFEGYTFSLSQNAQLNWQGLWLLKQSGLYKDTEISTKDGKPYILKSSKVMDFIKKASTVLMTTLKKGREEKIKG